jgi:hypothetical protein
LSGRKIFAKLYAGSFSLGAAWSSTNIIQRIVSPMIPTTKASADIQAIVHHKSSVFTLIVVNPTKRSVQILMPQRRGAE